MNFNFYEKYRKLPTTELLKIVRQADQYESEAITAAHQVLSEREVSEDEMAYVDRFFMKERAVAEKKNDRQNVVRDFFLTFVRPTPDNALVYVNGVVMLAAFECLRLAYVYYRPGGLFYVCKRCFDTWQVLAFLTPFLLAIIVCLMICRNWWGWLLLFGYCLGTLVNGALSYTFNFIRYKMDYGLPGKGFFIWAFIYVLFLVIVTRPRVKDSFGITENMRKTVAMAAVLLAALQAILISLPSA